MKGKIICLKIRIIIFFSKSVYDINENEEEFLKNDTVIDGNKKYKILSMENNKNNGMQAMAVAPVDSNGEVEILLKLNKQIKRV